MKLLPNIQNKLIYTFLMILYEFIRRKRDRVRTSRRRTQSTHTQGTHLNAGDFHHQNSSCNSSLLQLSTHESIQHPSRIKTQRSTPYSCMQKGGKGEPTNRGAKNTHLHGTNTKREVIVGDDTSSSPHEYTWQPLTWRT